MDFCVLISVYANDKAPFLDRALISIWDDQLLKPSQIVLVQDGPLNQELNEVINSWFSRLGNNILTLVSLKENVGLACALNEGLKYCQYNLVARMDADDIAIPHRFDTQVKFMLDNPEVSASSGVIEEFDDTNAVLSTRVLPLIHEDIVVFAKKRSPLSHPAAIFRKSVVETVGGYPLFRNAQDYALWSLLIVRGYKLANLPITLVKMRSGSEMMRRRGFKFLKREIELIRFQRHIGFLTFYELVSALVARSVLRLSPMFIKRLLYRFAR
ncbi:glycosyltransferase [Marinomonas sp. A79]|uniref:Glycosyltransferase n=1 Tax=Marinomonas vulgaris TaxID=2823372 RepID=A0ABS5HCF5_9GAMM|nr:glycosyltransferase [Marinomonas vulgaris]MBR7889330.1 glycosyltransferase [Marinomonas vulgaris]